MNLRLLHARMGGWLRPLGAPYAFFMRKRQEAYARGTMRSFRPSCPTLSIGNIAWGGTGKTPITAWMLEWAERRGIRAAVLTRGYGGNPGPQPLQVRPDTKPERSGDEPLMLARQFPKAFVIAHPRRSLSARYAQEALKPDMFILDDGMQHLAIQRDVNLVLLRLEDLDAEWNRVIPAGSWREGADALSRATAFLLRASPEDFDQCSLLAAKRLSVFNRPVFSFSVRATGLRRLFAADNGEEGADSGGLCAAARGTVDKERYAGTPYMLVSGVGNPKDVEKSAGALLGRPPIQHVEFADHRSFTETDVQAMVKLSPVPLPVVCTEKDAVKLSAFQKAFSTTPVWVLQTEVCFGPALFTESSFAQWWDEQWEDLRMRYAVTAGEAAHE